MLLNDFGFAVDLDPTLLQPFVGHRRFAPNAFLEKLQTTPGALFNYKIQHDLEAAVKVCIVSCIACNDVLSANEHNTGEIHQAWVKWEALPINAPVSGLLEMTRTEDPARLSSLHDVLARTLETLF